MSQITTHILDINLGRPASDVPVTLSRQTAGGWETLASGKTNGDGRIGDLLEAGNTLEAGCYRMRFDTQAYFTANREAAFYPYVDIVFRIAGNGEHYHIPLLLAAHGYSTYRGS